MNPDQYRRLTEVVLGALRLPTQDRAAYVQRELPGDKDLQTAARLCMQGEPPSDQPYDRPVLSNLSLGELWGGPEKELPAAIGNYVPHSVLGAGAFGVVYLAEQTEPLQRLVAVKVIKPGMDSAEVLRRFEAERQALALMDHPGVAKVLDAGVTEQARPYFVMEHVPGLPINHYCQRESLGLVERIKLLIKVCDAVEHAHQKGVIHRDLKPGNILVAAFGRDALPKVIDFGVAKALDRRRGKHSFYTEEGRLIGTPEYMSPEQARLDSAASDTRSDVYSLGVLCYELLTGQLPFQSARLRAGDLAEFQRVINEDTPRRPSELWSGSLANLDQAAQWQSTPSVLARQIRNDLDWVVMRCLEKQPDRRYPSARALSEDLRRYLSHEPVDAGPPSTWYRLSKLARRHRIIITAAAVIFLALTAATVISNMSLHRLQVAQGAEKAARLDLQFEATRSQTIADFLVQVLLTSTPEQQGASTTVVEALRRAPQMLAELKGDSQTVYDLRQSIGRMLFAHGDYGPAEESFRVARSMAAKLYGSGSKEHRDCGFLSARACMESGNYGRSEALLEEVLDHAQQEPFWPQSGDLEMLRSLAHLYAVQDDHEKAREIGGQAVDLARRKFGPDSVEVARGEQVWGAALYHLGEREVGSQIMRRSFQSLREGLGLRHPEAEAAAQNLWFLELREREVQPADELRLKEIEERYGDLHPFLGEVLQMLGDLAWANERVEDAHHYFQRCVDLRRDKLGEEHLRTAQAKHRLSQVFFSRGDFDRVIELLGEALGVFRHEIPESWETGVVLTKIGEVYYHSSRYAEAEPYFREALGFGRDRKRVGYLANCRFTQRFWDQETVSLMVEADRLWGDTDRRYNLIRTLQRVGDFAEVRKWSRRTIEERRHVQGVGDFKWYRYEVMAALEVRELELAEVALEELERRVVETQESVDAEAFSRERMLARAVDGCLALAFEDPEGAVPLLRVAIEHLGEDSTYFPSSGRLLSDLGAALWELGELAEAERCLSLAGQQLSAYFGESDWLTLRNDRRWRRLQEDLRQECAAVPSK